MPNFSDELQAQAAGAIERMRQAAREARHLHARAELARHMRTTAAKVRGRPRDEAAAFVSREWMQAWQLNAADPALAGATRAYAAAVCADAEMGTEDSDRAVRDAFARLEAAFVAVGTTLADQMAWRSECAHGWWELVAPAPPDLPARPGVPSLVAGQPFWDAGCAPHCRPGSPDPDDSVATGPEPSSTSSG